VTFTGGVISNTTSVTSGSTGYISGWIPVGDYTVMVTKNGASKRGIAKVTAGQTFTLNLVM
jgi:hypothetical protein